MAKVDMVEKQERIYKISLLLRRKSISFIIEYIRKEWSLEKAQAYNYIKEAKNEWKKYFAHLKGSGMSYHVAQLRDLKDQAYERKVVIGRGDNKDTVTIADLGLIFEITKEEAKLMGIYPASKIEEDINLKLPKGIDFNEFKTIKEMTEDEREILISQLSKVCGNKDNQLNRKDQEKDKS